MKPRGKKFYDELGNRIYNVMTKKYNNITRFTKAGSRRKGDFQRKSDLDIRFSLTGDPQRKTFYPKLKDYLDLELSEFKGEKLRYKVGTEGNVLQAFPEKGGKLDLVLLSESEYDRQEKSTDEL